MTQRAYSSNDLTGSRRKSRTGYASSPRKSYSSYGRTGSGKTGSGKNSSRYSETGSGKTGVRKNSSSHSNKGTRNNSSSYNRTESRNSSLTYSGTGYSRTGNRNSSLTYSGTSSSYGRTESRGSSSYSRTSYAPVSHSAHRDAPASNGVRRKKPVKKGRVKNSAMRIPVYIIKKDNKAKISFLTVVTIFIIFAGGMGIAMTSATISDHQTKRAEMQSEIKKLQEVNSGLRAEVSQIMKIDDVEKIAVTKLGMVKPKPHQIINLDIEKQSYLIQNPEFGKNTKKGFDIRSLFDILKIRIGD